MTASKLRRRGGLLEPVMIGLVGVLCALLGRSAVADELRIVDTLGLVRFTQDIAAPKTIEVVLSATVPEGEAPALTSVQGFAQDVRGESRGNGRYRFVSVAPGTWQIRLSSPGPVIQQILVAEEK